MVRSARRSIPDVVPLRRNDVEWMQAWRDLELARRVMRDNAVALCGLDQKPWFAR